MLTPLDPWRSLGHWTLPSQPQGEGISLRPSGTRVIISSEGDRQPVLSVAIPPRVLDALQPAASPEAGAGGTRGTTAADGRASGSSSPDVVGVVGLAAVCLAAALGVRAVVRRVGQRRSTT